MIVGKPLDPSVLDIGKPAVAPGDPIALVVPAGGGGESGSNAVDAEDGVPHAGAAALVAQDPHAADHAVDGSVRGQPLQGRFGEIEFRSHVVLKDRRERYRGPGKRERLDLGGEESPPDGKAPGRETPVVQLQMPPLFGIGHQSRSRPQQLLEILDGCKP